MYFSERSWQFLIGYFFFRAKDPVKLFDIFVKSGYYNSPPSLFKQILRLRPPAPDEARRKAAVVWLIEKQRNVKVEDFINQQDTVRIRVSAKQVYGSIFIALFLAAISGGMLYFGLADYLQGHTTEEVEEVNGLVYLISKFIAGLFGQGRGFEMEVYFFIVRIVFPAVLLIVAFQLRRAFRLLPRLRNGDVYAKLTDEGLKFWGVEPVRWRDITFYSVKHNKNSQGVLTIEYVKDGETLKHNFSLNYLDIKPEEFSQLIYAYMDKETSANSDVNRKLRQ